MEKGDSLSNSAPDFVNVDSDIHICNDESTIVYEISEISTQTNSFINHTKPILESTLLDQKEVDKDHNVAEISIVSESDGFVTHDQTGPKYDPNENSQSELDDSISGISENETDNGADQTLVCSTPIHQKCSIFVTCCVVEAEKRFYNGCLQQKHDSTFDECTVLGSSGDVQIVRESNIEVEHIHASDLTNDGLVFKEECSSRHTRKLCNLNSGNEQDGKSLEGSNTTDSDLPLAKRMKVDNNTDVSCPILGMTLKNVEHEGSGTLCSFLGPCENVVSAIEDKGRCENNLEASTKENVKHNSCGTAEPNVFVSIAGDLQINETKDENVVPGRFTNINECNYGIEIDLSHRSSSPKEKECVNIKEMCSELTEIECESESDVIVDCIIENNLNKYDFDNTWRRDLSKHCEMANSAFDKLSNKELGSNRTGEVHLLQVKNEGGSGEQSNSTKQYFSGSSEQSNIPVDKDCTLTESVSAGMAGSNDEKLELSDFGCEYVVLDTADITATEGDSGLKSSSFSNSFCKSDLSLPDSTVSNVKVSVDPITAEESDSDVEIIAVIRTPNTVNKKGCVSGESVKIKHEKNPTIAPLKLNFSDVSTEANVESVPSRSSTPDQLLDVKSKDTSDSTKVIDKDKMKKPDSQPFKSDDPQENIDNEDPEWDYMRKLETDEARYKAVRVMWQSQVIPNPSRDLTYHNFRKKRLESESIPSLEQSNTRGLKRAATEQLVPEEAKRARTNTVQCTTPIDNKIHLLQKDYIKKVAAVNNKYKNKKTNLVANYRKARDLVAKDLRGKFAQNQIVSRVYYLYGDGNLMAQLSHAEQCDKTDMNRELACTLSSLQAEHDANVQKLQKVKHEISKFCTFYKGLDNNENDPTQLSEIQMAELNKIDKMYDFYTEFYHE